MKLICHKRMFQFTTKFIINFSCFLRYIYFPKSITKGVHHTKESIYTKYHLV